jgi:hypothetical protein
MLSQANIRMKQPLRLIPALYPILLLFCYLSATSTSAQQSAIVYDNSGSGTNTYYTLNEYGNEVLLSATNSTLTQFQFEYYGDFVATGNEMARIRFYKMDGPPNSDGYSTPGTVLYDSGAFSITAGYVTKTFSGLSIAVPGDITWTVQFSGLVGGNGDEAGLVITSPPSVGFAYDDFWMKTTSGWGLFRWGGNPVANFAAQITGIVTTTTPPPTVGISLATSGVQIQWTGSAVLQVATNPAGPYTDVTGAANQYTFNTGTAPHQFWRLRQ